MPRQRRPRPDTPATAGRKAQRARRIMGELVASLGVAGVDVGEMIDQGAPVKPDAVLPPGHRNIDDDPMGRRGGRR